jgi:NAD(P)-dependent dehydrogenase (short-subunit alcohol dehydrogenase family)
MNIIDQFRLDGKVALVSGGSRGIGEAIAHGLAEQGAHVIVSSRKRESCDIVVQAIQERGFSAEAAQCHAGKVDDINRFFDELETSHGRLDILVNNGGTNPFFGDIGETPEAAFDKTVDVNFKGPFFMSERAVKLMKAQGGGAIVNVCSVNGIRPGLLQGVYSNTKAALINMTLAFAREYGHHGIRVNALCPGLVQTRMTEVFTSDEDSLNAVMKNWPLPRPSQPKEMVGAVLLMASDAGSYLTGQSIVVDGGATAVLA